jgi:hypothetical protein
MPYLKSRRPQLGEIAKRRDGVWWIPLPRAKALGFAATRLASPAVSVDDAAVTAAAAKLNRDASQRLRASRARRRLSVEARQAIERSDTLPG